MLGSLASIQADGRQVVDLDGRTVEIPDTVTRVGCLDVLCYSRMFMLGAGDKVVETTKTAAPWMAATNPKYTSIDSFMGDPNIERLLSEKVDLVLLRYNPEQMLAKFASVGIPAVISQPMGPWPDTTEKFQASMKSMVRLFGAVLGGESQKIAEDWCAYFDARVRFVSERTARIPQEERLRAYYIRGPLATNTQGRVSFTYWLGTLAGAVMVVKDTPETAIRAGVSMEDVIRWDPEVIFVGHQYPLNLVLKNPRWRDISAVKTGRVVPTPEGVYYWDGGPESVLLMEFIAKTLYPNIFPDLDMAAEVKDYYARFYRYNLSDSQVAKLLRGESPDGTRFNPLNN
jgi:iron complex transport system substrate-binding protein